MDKCGYIGIETLLDFCDNSKDHAVTPNDFMRMNRVRVPERKRGKWEEKNIVYKDDRDFNAIEAWQSARCSKCGRYHTTPYMYSFDNYNFCPNCGADMRGRLNER